MEGSRTAEARDQAIVWLWGVGMMEIMEQIPNAMMKETEVVGAVNFDEVGDLLKSPEQDVEGTTDSQVMGHGDHEVIVAC